ncbi:MAG: type II toxin-antitoxin system VapC family toxin, partial [Gammaproteobacteria bacterium]
MRRVFVDTGAWYALIDRADPDHGDVTTQFKAYRGRLVTSNFVFDETLTLLRYRLGWQSAHAFGEQMRA